MKRVLITAPAIEPISVAELRDQSRITGNDEDGHLAALITKARTYVEEKEWRAHITQTWDFYFDSFAPRLCLSKPPNQSITTVTYVDTNGDTQTVDSGVYELGEEDGLGFVRLAFNQDWPSDARIHPDTVIARVVCGYGGVSSVPATTKHAISMLAAHWYDHREPVIVGERSYVNPIPYAIEALMDKAVHF
jgi:uncharacterized phiE125 gp8 family phage protein